MESEVSMSERNMHIPTAVRHGLEENETGHKRPRQVVWIENLEDLGGRWLCNKTRAMKTYGLDETDLKEVDMIQTSNPHHPGKPMQLFKPEDIERLSQLKQEQKRQKTLIRRENELEERLRRLARGKMCVHRLPVCFREYVFGDYIKRLDQTKTIKQYGGVKKDYVAAMRVARLPPKWHKTWALPYLRGKKPRKRWQEEREVLRQAFLKALAESERRLAFFQTVVFRHHVLQFLQASDVASLVDAFEKTGLFREYSGLRCIPREYNCFNNRVRALCGDAYDREAFDRVVHWRRSRRPSSGFCRMVDHPFHPICGILACARSASMIIRSTSEERREMLLRVLGPSHAKWAFPPCVERFVDGAYLATTEEVEVRVRLSRFCEEQGFPSSCYEKLLHMMVNVVIKETKTWRQALQTTKRRHLASCLDLSSNSS